MKREHSLTTSLVAITGLALAVGSTALHAQTAWDGGGGNSDYSNNLNWAGDIIPGNANSNGAVIGNSSTQTGITYNTSTSYTSSGTGVANSLRVGTGTAGVGSLTLSGSAGTLTFGGDGYGAAAWIGSNNTGGNATGTVTVSAGKLAITGGSDASINLGVNIGGAGIRNGTLIINGGTVEVGRRILIAANDAASIGLLTISAGTLDMKGTGSNGEGDLGMIRLGAGTNTVNFDGGTAILSGLHTAVATNARSTIFFNGTTLKANVANADFILGTTANANLQIKNGGLIMDTSGFNVTIADALSNAAGHNGLLRKEGNGTLTLSAANSYSGNVVVNGGTLVGSFDTDLSSSGSFGNLQVPGKTITVKSGATLLHGTNDLYFNTAVDHAATSAKIVIDGGSLNTGTFFSSVKEINIHSGGSISGTNGVNASFRSLALTGTIRSNGGTGVASTIAAPGAMGGLHLGHALFGVSSVTFDVDAASGGLIVSAPLYNQAQNPAAAGSLEKTGNGTLTLSGNNAYTGTTAISNGKLLLNGTHAGGGTYAIASGATFGGTGTTTSLIQGAGLVSPGASPGIVTVGQIDPSAGMDYGFEFTATGSPNWNNPTSSVNDVLRVTSATPFVNGPFDADNSFNIYLNVAQLNNGDVFRGGIFTDADADFLPGISNADFNYFVSGDGGGGNSFEGINYYTLDEYALLESSLISVGVSTPAIAAANFASGTVDGRVMQFAVSAIVIPEPTSIALWILVGLTGVGLSHWRRRGR